MDAHLLHPTIGRECILAGDRPRLDDGTGPTDALSRHAKKIVKYH